MTVAWVSGGNSGKEDGWVSDMLWKGNKQARSYCPTMKKTL